MKRALFLAIPAIVLSGCREEKTGTTMQQALPIAVSQPIVRSVTLTRDYPGYLDADATVQIVARVNGTLQSKNYTDGDKVKKGALLFTIDPTLYKNSVTQAEAALKSAEAAAEYAQNNYERMESAIKSDAVSKIELLKARSDVSTAEAAVDNARAALSTAKTQLGYCTIRAPFDGVVTASNYSAGNYIAGGAMPVTLATIYKEDRMYVYFNITDAQWINKLRRPDVIGTEQQLTFSLSDDNFITRTATMDYLSPTINLTTGTLRVRASVDNSDGMLKSGTYITVRLPYENIDSAMLVRDASIGSDQLGNYLYIVKSDSTVTKRHIKTGEIIDDTMRVVLSGLNRGEKYVTEALLKVQSGEKVIPIPAGR